MANGNKRHLKRAAAPKSWLLAKSAGVFAPKPSSGPHNREAIPLQILIVHKLKLAVTQKDLEYILKNNMVAVNGRIRTDKKFPVGVMDVLSILKTDEHYRLLYNTEKRFTLIKITSEESKIRLCKVSAKKVCKEAIPYIYTTDGSSFRYCDPAIKVNDTVVLNDNKVSLHIQFSKNTLCYVIGGKNMGCVGVIEDIIQDKKFNIVKLVDANNRKFATQFSNAFVIGDANKSFIKVSEDKGLMMTNFERSIKEFGEIELNVQ